MANERTELAWVMFCQPARVDSQNSATPALARSATTQLYLGEVGGIPCVFIEDASLTLPGRIPMSNVASFGVQPVGAAVKKPAPKRTDALDLG